MLSRNDEIYGMEGFAGFATMDYSGLLIPDTEMGGKFTAIAEVFHEKTMSY